MVRDLAARVHPGTVAGYVTGLLATLLGLRVLYAELLPVTVAYADRYGWALWTVWALVSLAAVDLSLRARWAPAVWGLHAAAVWAVLMSLAAPLGWQDRAWAVLGVAYLWAIPVTVVRYRQQHQPLTTRSSQT